MRGAVMGALILALVLALAGSAQDLYHFEVASIRPSPPNPRLSPGMVPAPKLEGGPGTSDPGQITYKDIQLGTLIYRAYGLQYSNQLPAFSGQGSLFDIVARVPAGATADQLNLMLQNLLLERFNLRVHHESKILPAYALTVGKNGPKFKESSKAEAPEIPKGTKIGVPDDSGFPTVPPGYSGIVGWPSNGRIRWTGQRVAISKLAQLLNLDHPVVDQTGLTGEYDFKLDFAMTGRRNDAGATPPVDDTADSAPSVFAAVEDQLGLKLEPTKLPFDVLVIDHIDKEPTAN